jgi:hypothetical protein
MSRLAMSFCLLSLLLCSVGCRMCCTPHDYRISGYVDRYDDYRGFDPMYRAGSILGNGTCQTVIGDACYVGDTGDFYTNAGNYGVTTPVSAVHRSFNTFEPQPEMQSPPIGIPPQIPGNGDMITIPRSDAPHSRVPTVEDLLSRPRGMMPIQQPIIPPSRPKAVQPTDDPSGEVIPFSPNDAPVVPPSSLPTILDTDSPITLEELRRLDPSIRDMQIISIDDAAIESIIK